MVALARYPLWADKSIPDRELVATFEIISDGRNGHIRGLSIEESSGSDLYDGAALRAITGAATFYAVPKEFPADGLPVKVVFAFNTIHVFVGDLSDTNRIRQRLEAAEERRRQEEQAAQERRRQEEQVERQRRSKEEQAEQARRREADERRRREIASQPWPDEIKQTVIARKIDIGMTSEQETAAWGAP